MCTIVKTIEQGQRRRNSVSGDSRQSKNNTQKDRREDRYPQNPRYTRKTPVKSQQSVNQFILSFVCSVLDFGNPAVVLFNRGKQLSLNSLLSNHPNGQLTYIHKIVGTGKTIAHALHTANQVILRDRPTSPYHNNALYLLAQYKR